MVNMNIRNKLPPNTIILDNQSYDNSIIGLTFDGRAIYDYDLMVQELIDEGYSAEEAIDWIDYNTIRGLIYIGEKAPLVVTHVD